MSRLKIDTPDGHSKEVLLPPGRVTIGRGKDCTVVVDNPTLSRQHAALEEADGAWVIIDLGSKNGVKIDGRQVARAPLKAGVKFRLGKVEFTIVTAKGEGGPAAGTGADAAGTTTEKGFFDDGTQARAAGWDDGDTKEIAVPSRAVPWGAIAGGLGGLAAAGFLAVFLLGPGRAGGENKTSVEPPVAAIPVHFEDPAPKYPGLRAEDPVKAPDPEEPKPTEVGAHDDPPKDGTNPHDPNASTTPEKPPKGPTPVAQKRFHGRNVDVQQLQADGRLDAKGKFVVPPEDRLYVREVSFDLLGRAPGEAEIQQAVAESRGETVDRILRSEEHFETWYEEEIYYFLLLDNFRPATARLTGIPKKLADGKLTLPDAIHEIVISQYFNHRNPGNDTYVTVILEQLLGIVVQEQPMLLKAGKQMYDGYPAKIFGAEGASQADLVSIVFRQRRFYETLVERLYRRTTGVAIDPKERDFDVERVMADGKAFHEVMKEWVLSDSYLARVPLLRKKTDNQFIRSIYVDLLGRRATYEEFRSFRNALQALADPTPIRDVLAKVMVDSPQFSVGKTGDAKEWVRGAFEKFVGREPKDAELQKFSEAAGSGKPKLVIQALLDSLEYQYY